MKDTVIRDSLFMLNDSLTQIHQVINLHSDNGNSSALWTNVITIIFASIAAFIALYQAKSNIISKSRINWIENLRDSISSYCIEISRCIIIQKIMISDCQGKTDEEISVIIKEQYPKFSEVALNSGKLAYKISLYLNSKEDIHKLIENLIKRINKHVHVQILNVSIIDEVENDLEEIISISKIIFKTEWDKSKKLYKL